MNKLNKEDGKGKEKEVFSNGQ